MLDCQEGPVTQPCCFGLFAGIGRAFTLHHTQGWAANRHVHYDYTFKKNNMLNIKVLDAGPHSYPCRSDHLAGKRAGNHLIVNKTITYVPPPRGKT